MANLKLLYNKDVKKEKNKLKIKKGDTAIFLSIILLTLVLLGVYYVREFFLNKNYAELKAVIKIDGEVQREIYLSNHNERFTINTDKGYNIIWVHDGGIEIEEADCPDQICVNTAFINKPGQMIVCLPHKLVITIEGGQAHDIDDISQ